MVIFINSFFVRVNYTHAKQITNLQKVEFRTALQLLRCICHSIIAIWERIQAWCIPFGAAVCPG